ncbi:MAG TPA: hypothetical protein VFQ80_08080 [Thermomicrobiales bacterium]|nr:hypothetical protein [Thermomicrobiales bacterium]
MSRDGLGRRDVLKALAGGAFGIAVARAAGGEVDAGKKKRCVKDFATCPATADKCCSKECCDPITGQGGDPFCKPKDGVCCSAENGGGACSNDFPLCCPVGPRQRFGLCIEQGAVCCPIATGGGWCAAGETCCTDSGQPSCCKPAGAASAGRSAAVRPRRRKSGAKRR